MAKVAVLVLSDTSTREGLGRAVNAMIATKEFQDAGDEARLIFDGRRVHKCVHAACRYSCTRPPSRSRR